MLARVFVTEKNNIGKEIPPSILCVLSRNGNFYMYVCASNRRSLRRAYKPNDIKVSLFLSFFLASQRRSLCPHIVFRICALRTPVFDRVFKTLGMIIFSGNKTSRFIPRTPVLVRVFQTLEMTKFGSIRTSRFIPRTPVLVRIFQTLEATISGSELKQVSLSMTSVFVRIFQTLEVTI